MQTRSHRLVLLVPLAMLPEPAARSQDAATLTPDERNAVEVFRRSNPAAAHINAREKVALKFEDITPKSGVGTGFFFDRDRQLVLQPMH